MMIFVWLGLTKVNTGLRLLNCFEVPFETQWRVYDFKYFTVKKLRTEKVKHRDIVTTYLHVHVTDQGNKIRNLRELKVIWYQNAKLNCVTNSLNAIFPLSSFCEQVKY